MNTLTGYVPYDYRRLCDLCGNPWNRSKLHRQGPYMVCPDHVGERLTEELDRGNARQRPFRVLPVPNAKPEDQIQPDVFETEESIVFALLDLVTGAGARYARVASGSPVPMPDATDVLPTNGWACWHYYNLALATYPKGHQDVWHAQALGRLRTAAGRLLALQTVTGSRATNSFYGGFLASGATTYFSEDASVCGMAMLYAYRLLGDHKYIVAARAAANFLRNVQAIGSCGTNFTSRDAAGTARLYTGSLTNAISSAAGFYSDHRFYASALLTLWFWSELKLTDGDQTIGATATIASEFTLVPSQLMSTSMSDLRSFWLNGVYDYVTQDVRTGLSATTPAEFFNAFPSLKINSNVVGTGAWEYWDGPSRTGTIVSSIVMAKALAALYAVDGATDQIVALDAWFQTFTNNPAYATAANTSAYTLQRSTTGTYDPTMGIARYLLVRDATTLAAVAMNAGSTYDWGAYGLLAPFLAARRAVTFKLARAQVVLKRRRLSDGLPSDGYWVDAGLVRGRQGLSYQSNFTETLDHGGGPAL